MTPAPLVCTRCNATMPGEASNWRCACGAAWTLQFAPDLRGEWLDTNLTGVWRYRRAIPVAAEAIVTLGEPMTPLLPLTYGGARLLVKCDHQLPSGSFKDRGAAVVASHVRSRGIAEVVEDSSGNAGAALAAYCAGAGIRSRIFVPGDASAAKLAQIRLTGAEVVPVAGSRHDTALAVQDAANRHYYASHVWNPYFLHGTKTLAFELWEQLGRRAPEMLALPVGNGSLLLGVHLGFSELLAAGLVRRRPRLLAAQAESCAPLWRRWRGEAPAAPRPTLAEGIAVADPPRASEIVAAVRESEGEFIAVPEAAIAPALLELGRRGLCVEPTAAVVFAAIAAWLAVRPAPPEPIATLVSGHGLKAAARLAEIVAR